MSIIMKNICKKYDNNYALSNVNLNLNRGEVIGIVGKNGAGKTTLMKILCGNIVDFEGIVTYPDSSSKRNIGFLIENPKFYPNETGFQNLKIFSKLFSIENSASDNTDDIIKALNMEEYINKKSKKYSLGMKQRLGIAIALLGEPDFLILDEPTNGMDPNGIKEILKYLKRLAKEKQIGIFISSHQLDHIQEISDYILVIEKGKIIKKIDKSKIDSHKIVTITVKNEDITKTKRLLQEEGIDVTVDNKSLRFKVKDMSLILQKM